MCATEVKSGLNSKFRIEHLQRDCYTISLA
jgi:hypothetical protein